MKIGNNLISNEKNTIEAGAHDVMAKFYSHKKLRDFFKSLDKKELEEFDITRSEEKQRDSSVERFAFNGTSGNEVSIASGKDYFFDDIDNGPTKSFLGITDGDTSLDFVFHKFNNNPLVGILSLGFRFEKILSMTKGSNEFSILSKFHGFTKEYKLKTFDKQWDLLTSTSLSEATAAPLCNELIMQFERISNEIIRKKEAIVMVLESYRKYNISGSIGSILEE